MTSNQEADKVHLLIQTTKLIQRCLIRKTQNIVIYFIRSYNQFIKIGTSIDVSARLDTLQTGSPIKLHVKAILPGSYQTEKGLHEMFAHIRHTGEWFRYTPEMKWFLRAIQENPSITNIHTLYNLSLQMRMTEKSKRLGKDHKLSKRIKRIQVA